MTDNIYKAPEAQLEEPVFVKHASKIKAMRIMLLVGYFIFFFMGIASGGNKEFMYLFIAFAIAFEILVVMYCVYLQRNPLMIILICIIMFIPLLNLFATLSLYRQGNDALRKAGYEIGFFGARKPKPHL